MSGWIKWEKDLETDPRFVRMVRDWLRLTGVCNATALQHAHAVTLLSGTLLRMWVHADSHIRADNTLDMSRAELDEYLGVAGFCSICPEAWLIEVGEACIELPGFLEKNGAEAKKSALANKRVANHRARMRNAPALPDQTRPNQTRSEGERAAHARADGPRGTVIDAGSNLTRITAPSAFDSLLEDWRRDVPECNPDAFARWIGHVEESGRRMNPAMRLGQARRLAANGEFAAQLEVVQFCIDHGYKSLIPIGDVRARTPGDSSITGGAKAKISTPTDADRLPSSKIAGPARAICRTSGTPTLVKLRTSTSRPRTTNGSVLSWRKGASRGFRMCAMRSRESRHRKGFPHEVPTHRRHER